MNGRAGTRTTEDEEKGRERGKKGILHDEARVAIRVQECAVIPKVRKKTVGFTTKEQT